MMSASRKTGGSGPADGASNLWAAARAGDLGAIERHLASGVAVDATDPERGGTPLMWAAVGGRAEAVELLIERGADANAAGPDGGTALHGAAFLGHEKAVEALIRGGAKVNAVNKGGSTPLDTAVLDEGTTRYFASVLQLELNEDGLGRRKAAIAELLRAARRDRGQTVRRCGCTDADAPLQPPLVPLVSLVAGPRLCGRLRSWLPAFHRSACPPGWSSRPPATCGWSP